MIKKINSKSEFDDEVFEKIFEKVTNKSKQTENSVTKSSVISIIVMMMAPNANSYKSNMAPPPKRSVKRIPSIAVSSAYE